MLLISTRFSFTFHLLLFPSSPYILFFILILDSHLDCVRPCNALDFFQGRTLNLNFLCGAVERERETKQFNFLSHKQRTLIIHFSVFHLFAVLKTTATENKCFVSFSYSFSLSLHKHSQFGLNVTYGKLLLVQVLAKIKAKKQVQKSQYCPLNTCITISSEPQRLSMFLLLVLWPSQMQRSR